MFKAKGASVILWIGHGKVFLFSLMMSVLSGIIAICMYEFICGEVPFGENSEDTMEIYLSIKNE